jgi:hypothetical protein
VDYALFGSRKFASATTKLYSYSFVARIKIGDEDENLSGRRSDVSYYSPNPLMMSSITCRGSHEHD